MKKVVLLMIWMLMLTSVVKAQTEKGRWLVGTQVGDFSYYGQNQQRAFSGSLNPSGGYFVANGFLVGATLPLSFSSNRYIDYDYSNPLVNPIPTIVVRNSSVGYGLGPFVRYYIGSSKAKPYIGASYTYNRNTSKRTTDTDTKRSKFNSSILAPTLGVAYFINRTIALNAGLNYNIRRETNQSDDQPGPYTYTSNYFSLGIGFELLFGQ